MTVKDLWKVSPQSPVFIKNEKNGKVKEYKGEKYGETLEIELVTVTSYPMYKNVLEITVKNSREKSTLFDYRATLEYVDENGRIKKLDIFRANLETGNIKEYFHLAAINSGIMHSSILKIERSKPGKGKWEVIYDFWKKVDKTEV